MTVSGPKGRATCQLTIVGGEDVLALTPPLGWNSWNVWGASVDDAKVRAAADFMVASGLAAQGYAYVNIDDSWEGPRDPGGEITSNEKFPDMKALADYVHAKGLKIGIYSSPGPRTRPIHVSDDLARIRFTLEDRRGRAHRTRLTLAGLPEGNYAVAVEGGLVGHIRGSAREARIALPVSEAPAARVTITRTRSSP